MQIYLLKDVPGKGKRGEIINVNDGYGKNYLVKNGLGRVADNAVLSQVSSQKQSQDYHKGQEIAGIKAIIANLANIMVTVACKVGANGKMFGGVTGAEIAGLVKQQGFDIDKKDLVFDAIKDLGEYTIKCKFAHGLTGQFKLKVVEGK